MGAALSFLTPWRMAALAGGAALAGFFLIALPARAPENTAAPVFLSLDSLPRTLSVEGEAIAPGQIAALRFEPGEDTLALLSPLSPVHGAILRLSERETGRIYDIGIGTALSLQGFDPRTPVTLQTPGGPLHTALPMDWAGRLRLDLPRQAQAYPLRLIIDRAPPVHLTIHRLPGGAA